MQGYSRAGVTTPIPTLKRCPDDRTNTDTNADTHPRTRDGTRSGTGSGTRAVLARTLIHTLTHTLAHALACTCAPAPARTCAPLRWRQGLLQDGNGGSEPALGRNVLNKEEGLGQDEARRQHDPCADWGVWVGRCTVSSQHTATPYKLRDPISYETL